MAGRRSSLPPPSSLSSSMLISLGQRLGGLAVNLFLALPSFSLPFPSLLLNPPPSIFTLFLTPLNPAQRRHFSFKQKHCSLVFGQSEYSRHGGR
ncbi:hypothetical protein CKAN_02467500 [Cinnamomum micranthum f. kanehirae]|uniref:Uncharacterized protein n=1 Tax=Cinnamomum micranthum f. kanehirae TaxID=337451 RepID=A0A443PX28_9MAGN|nr:hypothetical protein CKAN_02467500 [Cinnamomum micranthum f. kanehirae]